MIEKAASQENTSEIDHFEALMDSGIWMSITKEGGCRING